MQLVFCLFAVGAAYAAPPVPTSLAQEAPSHLNIRLYGVEFANVWIDDRKLAAVAPMRDYGIEPGPHVVLIENTYAGIRHTEHVTATPGGRLTVSVVAPHASPQHLGAPGGWDFALDLSSGSRFGVFVQNDR